MAHKYRAAAAGSTTVVEPKATDYPTPAEELTESEIATRAYSYWEMRGFQGGSAEDDWQRAIEDLKRERQR